ncbi:SAV_2336 N-terminal domain-related protein [Streptomyces sp. YGL11-2]|uniref:SAV_2336 N-terminal domain-related protein n=1 Tax=Streptomyces sp. YGL11-2 TaxID=3414028 RepID=UPI003CEE21B9
MFRRLCALLEDAGADLTTEELRDILWFAVTTAPSGDVDGDAGRSAGPTRSGGAADGGPLPAPDSAPPAEPRPGAERRPEPAADAGLFAPGGPRRTAARPAQAVGIRGVPALPAARGLTRALRPLRQSVPSRRAFALDETATADWIADTGLPDAVLRPERERWLSVALVVDDGPSMVLWQQLAAEIRGMLERQGAFLHVRTYGLDSGSAAQPVLTARPFAPGAPRRSTGHLNDTSGRTAVLVLSDGVGPGWRSGAIARTLLGWARHAPVAVVQPLPPRMWPEQGMPTQRLLVSADRPGAPGRNLSVRHPVLPPGLVSYKGSVVPVLDLSPARIGAWADLTATGRGSALLPVMLLGDDHGAPDPAPDPAPAADGRRGVPAVAPEERLRRFRAAASPESQRLAGALAAVSPLTLPVMRLVHQAGGDRAERFHPAQLAEVFLGGLLRRREAGPHRPSDAVAYEFHPGIADLLLDTVQTSTALDTAAQVTAFLLRRHGSGPEFRARLAGAGGDVSVAERSRPFAAASPELLSRLGLLAAGPDEQAAAPAPEPATAAPGPTAVVPPPRSYASERVQPPLIALVRRFAQDDGLPEPVRRQVDRLLREADDRDDESGWSGVRELRRLARELVDAGWRDRADALREAVREQLGGLVAAEDLESRNLRGHLALALNVLGEHEEAEDHLRAVVEISGHEHGREHDYTLYARDYLIDLLEHAKRNEAAEEECRTLIAAYQRRANDECEQILTLRLQRGRLLLNLDRLEEAEAEFRAVHAERLVRKGAAHSGTVLARVWLATALQRLRRYDEAEAEARAAAADARSAPQPDESSLRTALFRLGFILNDRESYDEAQELWSDLAGRARDGLGPTHARTLEARRWHIAALRGLGRYEDAGTEAAALMEGTAEGLGERHLNHFNACRVRALVMRDQKRYEEAEAALRTLLDEQLQVLGPDHDGTLLTRHELALTLDHADRNEESLAHYEEALRGHRRNGQDEEPGTLVTRSARADLLVRLDRLDEAEAEYRAVLEARQRTLGPGHPDTLIARRMLANALRDQERYEEAEAEFRGVIEGRTRVLGAEAWQTLAARHSLGYVLNQLSRFAEAEREIRVTLDARTRVLGAEQPGTLWTRHNLGIALRGLGRLDEAEAEWRAVLAVSERELGDEHTCTRDTRARLAELDAGRDTAGG